MTAPRQRTADTCTVCGQPVIKASLPQGEPVQLRPRRAPKGLFAAREIDGTWQARHLLAERPLDEGEARYTPHTCKGRSGGLDAVRKAQAGLAHQQRARRGRHPRSKPVTGVRIPPPGGNQ